jgi:flagellar secretion chaperone FliS
MQNLDQRMQQYQSMALEAQIENATPHTLITLLLQGAKTHITAALHHLQNNQIKEKGEHLGKAISIVEYLQTCLNHQQGLEIAENLDNLYDYIKMTLLKASLQKDREMLLHANQLIDNIYQGWQAMPQNPTPARDV